MGQSQHRRAGRHDPGRPEIHLGSVRDDALLCPIAEKRTLEFRNQAELYRFVADFQNLFQGRNPFTLQTLAHFHYITVRDIYPCGGNTRDTATDLVEVGGSFDPAEPYEVRIKLPELLDRACRWREEIASIPPSPGLEGIDQDVNRQIAFATRMFYELILIHPFRGGNGRVSRAFLNMLLYDMNLLQPPEQIFGYMAYRRAAYFMALRRADGGDMRPLYTFIARGIFDSVFEEIHKPIRNGQNWPQISKRLNRDLRRFFDQHFRAKLSDEGYFKRWRKLSRELSKFMDRQNATRV